MQQVTPYLLYDGVEDAAEFLTAAFGFRRAEPRSVPEGYHRHTHLEVELGDGSRIRINRPEPGQSAPSGGPVHSMLQVNVDDVDAHFERAKAAGAAIVMEVGESHGERVYQATDPEGHLWKFIENAGVDGDGR